MHPKKSNVRTRELEPRTDARAVSNILDEVFGEEVTPDSLIFDFDDDNCYRGIVAQDDTGIIGGVLLFRFVPREGVLVVLNAGVLPDCRREGFGTALFSRLKTCLRDSYKRITVDVLETDLVAQMFLRHVDFLAVAITTKEGRTQSTRFKVYRFEYDIRERPNFKRQEPKFDWMNKPRISKR